MHLKLRGDTYRYIHRDYLIDICDPQDNFTLAQYQEQAEDLINNLHYSPLGDILKSR